jgi:NAD(P)H-hydrate epimerase
VYTPAGATGDFRTWPSAALVISLDVPSGLDATTGGAPGAVVRADRTLTLALPKTGLAAVPGDLVVADIGIPPEVYGHLGLSFAPFFRDRCWVRLLHSPAGNCVGTGVPGAKR